MTITRFDDLTLNDDLVVGGDASVAGALTVTGALAAASAAITGALTAASATITTLSTTTFSPTDVVASGTGTFPRLASATQGSGTFSAGVAQNLFTLADGDAVELLVTARSGTDFIWRGLVARNVNLYTQAYYQQGGGVISFGMSGNTLQITSSTLNIGFKYTFTRPPAF